MTTLRRSMHLLRQLSNASEEVKHLLTARNARRPSKQAP